MVTDHTPHTAEPTRAYPQAEPPVLARLAAVERMALRMGHWALADRIAAFTADLVDGTSFSVDAW
jgi:hypothetical protein